MHPAQRIFEAGLRAADPREAIRRHFRLTGDYDRIFVVGAGKAGAAMAQAIEQILGDRITGGLVNVKDGHTLPLSRIELNECGHPVPDARGVRGAARIAQIAHNAGPRDLVLCLVSGGASALAPLPAPGFTLEDKQETTRLLLTCGASIHEINAVRKHLSAIKGGRLAELAAPAKVIALILSDVIGDDLDVIGSGMTAPDCSTVADARRVLERYRLLDRVPAAVARCEFAETPKHLGNVENIIVGSNALALDAAEAEARALGYNTLVLSSTIDGETRDIARMHAAVAREIATKGRPVARPACVLSGGETTVTLRGSGRGGRNQEFVLAALLALEHNSGITVLSAGTDGTDGPTDAAGALADPALLRGAKEKGLDAQAFLDNNDSYTFFDSAGALLRTGPTNTNVMDVRVLLVD